MLDNFYNIDNISCEDKHNIFAQVTLNPTHSIYTGHFVNNPVVPGVCMIYMIQNIISSYLKKEVVIDKITSCKFLKSLIPNINSQLSYEIKLSNHSEGSIKLEAVGFSKEQNFIKFKGTIQCKQLIRC